MDEDDPGFGESKVTRLATTTTLPLSPDQVLRAALGELTDVWVIGWNREGELYFASSTSEATDGVYVLEKAKQVLLEEPE